MFTRRLMVFLVHDVVYIWYMCVCHKCAHKWQSGQLIVCHIQRFNGLEHILWFVKCKYPVQLVDETRFLSVYTVRRLILDQNQWFIIIILLQPIIVFFKNQNNF